MFARVVLLAELAAGAALVLGVRLRMTAALALLMVLNFHVASDVIFDYSYLTNGYGLPVLSGLLALALAGTRLPFSRVQVVLVDWSVRFAGASGALKRGEQHRHERVHAADRREPWLQARPEPVFEEPVQHFSSWSDSGSDDVHGHAPRRIRAAHGGRRLMVADHDHGPGRPSARGGSRPETGHTHTPWPVHSSAPGWSGRGWPPSRDRPRPGRRGLVVSTRDQSGW